MADRNHVFFFNLQCYLIRMRPTAHFKKNLTNDSVLQMLVKKRILSHRKRMEKTKNSHLELYPSPMDGPKSSVEKRPQRFTHAEPLTKPSYCIHSYDGL